MSDDLQQIDLLRRELIHRDNVDPGLIRVARAPYRICPLGAHIDHQRGTVTAMAIDRSVLLAYAPGEDRLVRLSSLNFSGIVEFSLDAIPGKRPDDWGNYARGAALALQHRHKLHRGIAGVTSGTLHGGGVSSSAAVGVAFLLAFEDANGLTVSPADNILLDQAIENDYLGLRNGILDQAAILLSRRGFLTRIDCASNCHDLIPAPASMPPFKILLVFSGVRKALAGTDYNLRVEECASAARTLLNALGRDDEPAVLGRVTSAEYEANRSLLQGPAARRAAHFFSESDRVRRGVESWQTGDLTTFGRLVTASGESSIRNYECGSRPLIDLYQTLIATEGVLGARFSGAGFRGCCVALVTHKSAEEVARSVLATYTRLHPELAGEASAVVCEPADGVSIIDTDPFA